jgi:hypothetical protein
LLTNTLQQKIHLIRKYIPVSQKQAFVKVGRVGNEKRQVPPFMRLAIALGTITAFAGRQNIRPNMLAALGDRTHMIRSEFIILETLAAIGT